MLSSAANTLDPGRNLVLANLPGESMHALLDQAERLQFDSGQYVVREGDCSDALFFVIEGEVSVLKNEVEIDRQSSGGVIGEMGVLTGDNRNACVRCLTGVVALRVSAVDFRKEVDNHPAVLRTMIASLIDKVQGSHGIRVEQANKLDRARDIMLRCVSTEVLNRVFDQRSPEELLEGHLQFAAILFFDIRGFSSLAEYMPPEQLLHALNAHLEVIIETVDAYEGVIVNFIGDAVLAIFNCPVAVENPTGNALDCCLKCRRKIRELHEKRGPEELVCFDVGAGLNCGTVVAGAIGSEKRFTYSVLGDEVNLAARLENLTRQYPVEIIFSEAFHEKLDRGEKDFFFDRVKVKGRETPLNLYTPSELEIADQAAFAVARDLYLQGAFSEAKFAFAAQSGELARYFEERCANLEGSESNFWPGYFSWEIK